MRRKNDFIKHLKSLGRWRELRRWYRYHFPIETDFFDGKTRLTKRGVHRVFNVWLKSEEAARESAASYQAYEGGDFIDVGAYEGFYSLLLAPKARAGAKFLAMEPDNRFFSKLLMYLGEAKNLFPHIQFYPLPLACGDGSAASVNCTSGITTLETICVDSLVDTLRMTPTFIKIDVEGLEYSVLKGMQKTLSNFKPTIMLELHPKYLPQGVSAQDVDAFLRNQGYTSADIDITELTWRQLWKQN